MIVSKNGKRAIRTQDILRLDICRSPVGLEEYQVIASLANGDQVMLFESLDESEAVCVLRGYVQSVEAEEQSLTC
jgi:hypothetical protein